MTEDDVKKMDEQVGRPDPAFHQAWMKQALEGLRNEEQAWQAKWLLYKSVLDKPKMQEVFKNLEATRELIAELEKSLGRERPALVSKK